MNKKNIYPNNTSNKLFLWMIHFTEISEKSIFPNLICHLLLLYFTILKKLYLVLILFFLKDVMKELISVCFVVRSELFVLTKSMFLLFS